MTSRTKAPKGEQYQEPLRGDLAAYEKAGLHQRSVGPRTAYRYRGALLRYQQALGKAAPSLVAWQEFLAHLKKREFAASTLRLYRAALQGFHSWRGEQLIFPVKVPRQVPTYVEANAVERVLELAWQYPRDRLFLLLISDAGLRREEVVNLLVGDVGRDAIRFRGKGDKYRTVPFTARLAEACLGSVRVSCTGWSRSMGNRPAGRTSTHTSSATPSPNASMRRELSCR